MQSPCQGCHPCPPSLATSTVLACPTCSHSPSRGGHPQWPHSLKKARRFTRQLTAAQPWSGAGVSIPTLSGQPGPRARWAWAPAESRHTRPRLLQWQGRIPSSSTSSSQPGTDRGTVKTELGRLLHLCHPASASPEIHQNLSQKQARTSRFNCMMLHPSNSTLRIDRHTHVPQEVSALPVTAGRKST